jgi:hypothetical protein
MEWFALAFLWLLERMAGGALSTAGKGLFEKLAERLRIVSERSDALADDAVRATAALDENAAVIADLIVALETRDAEIAALRKRAALHDSRDAENAALRADLTTLRGANARLRAELARLTAAVEAAAAPRIEA